MSQVQGADAEQVNAPEEPLALLPTRTKEIYQRKRSSTKYIPQEYMLLTDRREPGTYEEAVNHEKKKELLKVMQEDMKSLHGNTHIWSRETSKREKILEEQRDLQAKD